MPSKISIVADDLGYCQQRSNGIFALHSLGLITTSSILANGAFAKEDVLKAKSLGLPLRLHLNLTEGKPLALSPDVASLIGDNDLFLGKVGLRKKLSVGGILPEHIENECRMQISWYYNQLGYPLQSFDGHQHIHTLPIIRDVIVKLMKNQSITTRIPFQENIESYTYIDSERLNFYKTVNKHSDEAKEIFRNAGIRSIPHFIGLSTMGKDMSIENFEQCLKTIEQKYSIDIKNNDIEIEFMVHPGFKSNYGQGGCGNGPDEFSISIDREHEMNFLQCKPFHNLLKSYNIEIYH